MFVDTGIITIAAFISPSNDIREMAANIIGKDDFLEVYVSTPIEECERRDVKGLYAKARRGEDVYKRQIHCLMNLTILIL